MLEIELVPDFSYRIETVAGRKYEDSLKQLLAQGIDFAEVMVQGL